MRAPCEMYWEMHLSLLTKNLWYEQREQLDSGSGGSCHKVQDMTEAFFDSINLSAVLLENNGKYGFW